MKELCVALAQRSMFHNGAQLGPVPRTVLNAITLMHFIHNLSGISMGKCSAILLSDDLAIL